MTELSQEPEAVLGRPTIFTQELADKICSMLADGMSLRSVCREEEMPDKATVFRWIRENEDFRDQYARAKDESADALVDEILDISDDGNNDWMEQLGEDGQTEGWKLNGEHIQRSKLRVDSRKWIASKMKPKKYGEKLDLTTKGDKLKAEDPKTLETVLKTFMTVMKNREEKERLEQQTQQED